MFFRTRYPDDPGIGSGSAGLYGASKEMPGRVFCLFSFIFVCFCLFLFISLFSPLIFHSVFCGSSNQAARQVENAGRSRSEVENGLIQAVSVRHHVDSERYMRYSRTACIPDELRLGKAQADPDGA